MSETFETLGFGENVIYQLRKAGINDLDSLLKMSWVQLWDTKGIGNATIEGIYRKLRRSKYRMRYEEVPVSRTPFYRKCLSELPTISSAEIYEGDLKLGLPVLSSLEYISDDRLVEAYGKKKTLKILSVMEDLGLKCGKDALLEKLRKETPVKPSVAVESVFRSDFLNLIEDVRKLRKSAGPEYKEALDQISGGLSKIVDVYTRC